MVQPVKAIITPVNAITVFSFPSTERSLRALLTTLNKAAKATSITAIFKAVPSFKSLPISFIIPAKASMTALMLPAILITASGSSKVANKAIATAIDATAAVIARMVPPALLASFVARMIKANIPRRAVTAPTPIRASSIFKLPSILIVFDKSNVATESSKTATAALAAFGLISRS